MRSRCARAPVHTQPSAMPACAPEYRLARSNTELVFSPRVKRCPHQTPPFTALRRSFSSTFSLIPEERAVPPEHPPAFTRFVRIVTWLPRQFLRPFFALLSFVAHPAWKQILVVLPTLWIAATLFIFWKCVQWPLGFLKMIASAVSKNPNKPRTVLISGGGSVQALHLARNFHSAGARVVAFEIEGQFALLKYSAAVDRFYTVPRPNPADPLAYARVLEEIVRKESVVFYIPVSSTTPAYYDALAKPHLEVHGCQCFIPNARDVVTCLIRIPYKLKLHVTTTENASVFLTKLEADEFIVKTQKGDVKVADMKADNLKVESESGDLETEGRLQASLIDLKTGAEGNIKCNNIMANNFSVATHGGQITVKSCYSDQSHFTTLMGNIRLDNLHRSVKIDVIQSGNLHITGFHGSLEASLKSGQVFMHASKFTDKSSIFIHEKGKVEVLVPDIVENLPAASLIADKINVDEKILKLGRFMDDSHPKRFRYEKNKKNELHIVCRNGSIDLNETDLPFFVPSK